MARLDGKVALVTAAGGAIAGASAKVFAAEGAAVMVCDIDEAAAQSTVRAIIDAGGRAQAQHCDVADPTSASDAVEACIGVFGGLDVLMNAAAAREQHGNVVDLDLDEWNRAMAVNLTGMFLMCKYAIPHMGSGGSIIVTSRIMGVTGRPNSLAYITSKHALVGLVRCISKEVGGRNFRANFLAPGTISNAFQQAIEDRASALTGMDLNEMLNKAIPLGRHAEPEEIAKMVLFLASNQSSCSTGGVFMADGNWHA